MTTSEWSILELPSAPGRLHVLRNGKVVATLAKTPWGKWKIVGEDTYGKTADDLLARLINRH